ncbi:MAG TPA: serine/threonine-protein kinase [Myxococcaceae bacterium]|nr:serine/threonine-protein kinase [Myxococcaceae bacterium]
MSQPLAPRQLRPGDSVRDYRVIRRVGRGGFSFVFLIERAGQPFAMKMASRPASKEDPYDVDRWLRREATSLEQLTHPNLLPVYEMGRWPDPREGYSFYVTEHVEGESFHVWRRRARATPHQWTGVLCEVLGVLEFLHERGFVHRDFKADNLLVRTADARPYLIDFGSVHRPGARPLTQLLAPGTVYCMPPEAISFAGEHLEEPEVRFEARPSADLYAVGVLLYECLTERRPFDPKLPLIELTGSILHSEPPDPRHYNPQAPASLMALALRLMAKEPAARPESARAVREELERLRAEEGQEEPWQVPAPPLSEGEQELLAGEEPSGTNEGKESTPPAGSAEGAGGSEDTSQAGRRKRRLLAVVLGLGLLGLGWMLSRVEWGPEPQGASLHAEPTAPEQSAPHAERGPLVQSRQNNISSPAPSSRLCTVIRAILGAAVAQLVGCATTPPVRTLPLDPLAFLEQCPTEARITPRELGFQPDFDGPDYYWYPTYLATGTPASERSIDSGGPLNLRSGPVRAFMRPIINGKSMEYVVAGEAVVTPLRVYIHINRIQLPDGTWKPICGAASHLTKEWGIPTYEAEKDSPTPLTKVDRAPGSVVLVAPVFLTFIKPANDRVRPTFLKLPPPEKR